MSKIYLRILIGGWIAGALSGPLLVLLHHTTHMYSYVLDGVLEGYFLRDTLYIGGLALVSSTIISSTIFFLSFFVLTFFLKNLKNIKLIGYGSALYSLVFFTYLDLVGNLPGSGVVDGMVILLLPPLVIIGILYMFDHPSE